MSNVLNSSSAGLNLSNTDDDSGWRVLGRMDPRPQTQQSAFLTDAGRGLSRDFGSGHDNSDRHPQASNFYGDSGYGAPSEPSTRSQRPSVSGLPFTPNNARGYDQNAGHFPDLDLTTSYLGNLDVSDGTNGAVGGSSNDPRTALDSDPRLMAQQFVQQPQAHLFQNGYFAPEYSHFQQIYGTVPDARQPTPFTPGFGMPVPPFLFGGAVQTPQAGGQDAWRGMRSEVLERIRRNSRSIKQLELKNLSGQISEICGDQAGSRFIQGRLESANSDEKEHVFHEIMPNAVQLMKCAFGNYVIQKLFEHGDQAHKKALARAMKGRVVELSTDKYACRVVQKALEYVLVDQQAELVKELEKDVLTVVESVHGNHVVSQIIAVVPRQHIDFIMDCLKARVQQLSCHQYACRVIQRALEHGSETDKLDFMKEVHDCGPALLSDPYGNYVAQHVIVNGDPEDHARMVNLVMSQLVALAKSQCGSHVVERCILHGTLEERRAMRDLLTTSGEGADSLLFQLMRDQFGNYVIQKLANSLQGPDKDEMIDKMKPYLQRLRVAGATGKQISCMENLIRENTPNGTTATSTETATENTPAATPTSTAPTSPGPALRLDLNGDAPLHNLTMDPNSPLTPPSVTASNGEGTHKEDHHQAAGAGAGAFRPLERGQVKVL
ncbi:mRNA binding protein puf3 [Collariella sp. IMI 366227]|nr:mRNA binding protein puf3 [Collariella sp. IMI 366227]